MTMIPDDKTEGFSFIWTIQNFSYCLQQKGEFLSSPHFKFNWSDKYQWNLVLYPRGKQKDKFIKVFLSGPSHITVKKCISIRAINGTFKRNTAEAAIIYEKQMGSRCTCVLNHSELFKKGDDAFLENDTLTLRCRILEVDSELPVPGQCYARTVIDVKRIAFVSTLENFEEFLQNRETINFNPDFSATPSFTIDIFLSRGYYDKRKIQVQIKQTDTFQKSYLTCKLSSLDADKKTVQSVSKEYFFEASQETQNWCFQFMPVKKILDHKKLYLVNGALSMRWEFAVSAGEKYSEVERIEYRVPDEHDKKCYSKTLDTGFPGSWKDNLQQFYKESKFSDLIIQTARSKKFPVHKAIMCARSKVFSAMFEHDTKENRTGVVEIEDLNDDTVSKMLLFIYTDIVEGLEWQTASELYFAADKYGIVALKRKCSTFLKGNLHISNVCEVLVMADMHQDQDMKSAAQDFVMEHATEIINSEYWKKFIQDKSNLAAETMHLLCIRNLKI